MDHQTSDHGNQTQREKRFMQRLRAHPELMARFESILELSEVEGGPLRSADEIEAQLVAEVRSMGSEVMHDWAARAEERAADELSKANPKARIRKKNG
jgi:hypothetical protein